MARRFRARDDGVAHFGYLVRRQASEVAMFSSVERRVHIRFEIDAEPPRRAQPISAARRRLQHIISTGKPPMPASFHGEIADESRYDMPMSNERLICIFLYLPLFTTKIQYSFDTAVPVRLPLFRPDELPRWADACRRQSQACTRRSARTQRAARRRYAAARCV